MYGDIDRETRVGEWVGGWEEVCACVCVCVCVCERERERELTGRRGGMVTWWKRLGSRATAARPSRSRWAVGE